MLPFAQIEQTMLETERFELSLPLIWSQNMMTVALNRI